MNAAIDTDGAIASLMDEIGRAALAAASVLSQAGTAAKNLAIMTAASAVRSQAPAILAANRLDV